MEQYPPHDNRPFGNTGNPGIASLVEKKIWRKNRPVRFRDAQWAVIADRIDPAFDEQGGFEVEILIVAGSNSPGADLARTAASGNRPPGKLFNSGEGFMVLFWLELWFP